ncbi:MAG: hypothetical protein WC516_05625 [Patescibacteria group bacterium]|jgi:hypothetical protein
MSIEKIAVIVKRKNKWCVLSHKRDKDGKRRGFGCYDSKEKATKRLQQLQFFKHRKAILLNIMTTAVDRLESKGIIHIADVVDLCTEEIAAGAAGEKTAIKLMKVVNLLEKNGEFDLAEQIDFVIPEILDKSFNCEE